MTQSLTTRGQSSGRLSVGCCAAAPCTENSICCFTVPEEPCGGSPAAAQLRRRSSDWKGGQVLHGAAAEWRGVAQPLHSAALGGAAGAPRPAGATVTPEAGIKAVQEERQDAQQLLEHLQVLLAAATSQGPDAAGDPAVPDDAGAAARAEPAAASAAGSSRSSSSASAAPSEGLATAESPEGAALACAAGGSAESIMPTETPTSTTSLPDRGCSGGSQGRGSGSGAGAGDMAASPIGGMFDAQEAVLSQHDGILPDAAAGAQPAAQAGQAPAQLPPAHLLGEDLPPLPLQAAAPALEGPQVTAMAIGGPAAALWTSKHVLAGAPPPQKARNFIQKPRGVCVLCHRFKIKLT